MTCKYFYLGDSFTPADWSYGLGTIFVNGPKIGSWVNFFTNEFERKGFEVTFFIAYSDKDLEPEAQFHWMNEAIKVCSAAVFWIPKGVIDVDIFVQCTLCLGYRPVFLGIDDLNHYKYLQWVYKNEESRNTSSSLRDVVTSVTNWLKE